MYYNRSWPAHFYVSFIEYESPREILTHWEHRTRTHYINEPHFERTSPNRERTACMRSMLSLTSDAPPLLVVDVAIVSPAAGEEAAAAPAIPLLLLLLPPTCMAHLKKRNRGSRTVYLVRCGERDEDYCSIGCWNQNFFNEDREHMICIAFAKIENWDSSSDKLMMRSIEREISYEQSGKKTQHFIRAEHEAWEEYKKDVGGRLLNVNRRTIAFIMSIRKEVRSSLGKIHMLRWEISSSRRKKCGTVGNNFLGDNCQLERKDYEKVLSGQW